MDLVVIGNINTCAYIVPLRRAAGIVVTFTFLHLHTIIYTPFTVFNEQHSGTRIHGSVVITTTTTITIIIIII